MTEKNNTTIRVTFPFKDMQLWQRLVVGLRYKNRFTLQDEPARFVESLLEYATKHKTISFQTNKILFRARINDAHDDRVFALSKLGAPPKERAGHGRLNPNGIPYLYLASDKTTAISEVRPWVGCKVTIAEFKLKKEVRLINFSEKHFVNVPKGEEYEGSEFTWRELISWIFSAPFDPRDDTAYVPTQYLSERIKGAGFDGIIYDSALDPNGFNVTLFDTEAAEPICRELATVRSIKVMASFQVINENKC